MEIATSGECLGFLKFYSVLDQSETEVLNSSLRRRQDSDEVDALRELLLLQVHFSIMII